MTGQEAYMKLYPDHILDKVDLCLDFGSFFVFFFRPMRLGPDERYCTGAMFDAVRKSDGKTFLYDITSDYDAYKNAKEVPIETVFQRKN